MTVLDVLMVMFPQELALYAFHLQDPRLRHRAPELVLHLLELAHEQTVTSGCVKVDAHHDVITLHGDPVRRQQGAPYPRRLSHALYLLVNQS